MSASHPQLRRKLATAFVLVALLAALCFSLFCLLFVYTVEDHFFDRMLAREGPGDWDAQPVPLLPLVEQAVIRHAHLLDSAAFEMRVSVPSGAQGHCHAPSLEILLDNLVANAACHAGGGILHIYIEEGWLVVRDDGPGLDAQVAARLGQAGARREGSSVHGLGLSIAHRLGARAGIALRIANMAGGGVRAALHVHAG